LNLDGSISEILWSFFSGEIFHLSPKQLFIYILQFFVLAYLIFILYWRVIRGTLAEKAVNGIVLLAPIIVSFYVFKLSIFIKLFELFLPAIVVGMVVLFAPEIRRFLTNLGRDGLNWLNLLTWVKPPVREEEPTSIKDIAREINEAVEIFSRNKTGALIVFDNTWSDRLYINSGRKLDAIVSTELLLNIFYPKSPLHDGAVLIRNKRIHAASVILPITENPKLNPWQYGTRHRAALGISENSPSSLCLVVSEETGSISIAEAGKISKVSSVEELAALLEIKLLGLEREQG
jgi:diadenylate cyclase